MPPPSSYRRRLLISVGLGLVTLGAFVWLAIGLVNQDAVYPGDVVINEFSTGNPDWIRLYNRTRHDVDLSGFIVSDGKNVSRIPGGTIIARRDSLVIMGAKYSARADRSSPKPDALWGGSETEQWGFDSAKREFILLLNRSGNTMIDFVHTLPLSLGEYMGRTRPGGDDWVRYTGCLSYRSGCRPVKEVERGEIRKDVTRLQRVVEKQPGEVMQSAIGALGLMTQLATQIKNLLVALTALFTALFILSATLFRSRQRTRRDEPPPAVSPEL